MAAEKAFVKPAVRNGADVAALARGNELPADAQASRPQAAPGLLRPSQVPVSRATTRRTGFSFPAGQRAHSGGPKPLRPSRTPAAAVRRSAVDSVLRNPGQPLAAPLKEEMQARLGADFSRVRVHTDDAARASATALSARAYTSGNHVVIGAGAADRHILAHELTHVIQQREGPVSGSDDRSGLVVSDPSDRFEQAAEAAAGHAVRETLPRPGGDVAEGRLLQAHRPAPLGKSTGSLPVPAARRGTPAPDKHASQGAQQLRGGLAHIAADAPPPIQRLTVDNKDVDIASLSTREAEDYLGSRPPDVSFGPRDAAEQALSIKGRIDALDRQIRESTAKIRVANKLAPYSRRENTWPSETSVTIWTLPHLFAAWKKWGPLNIWSAEKGQRQATGSRGYMLGQTPYYFLGMARVIAAYGKADVDERDPDYHRKFMQWIEQPIEDEDLVKAGISDRTKFQDKDGGLRIRYALLGDLTGEAYVLSKLAELRATEPQAGGSPAMEVKQGVGEPAGQYDQLSKGTSKIVSKSQWPGPLTGNEMELIGFHDANFHSIWDLASAQVVVDAVRSFTPIASYGIPGHGAPEKTIQAQVEIPAIQKEARLQKEEIGRLVEMLRGYYITHVDDHKVKDGLENLSQGIGKYAEGADALAIDLAAKNFNADGTISEARLKEDVKRKAATVSMREGGASIRQGLGKLKGSDSYRKYKFK